MYNYQYFKNSMPDWKKKKDPLIARIFYRPLSFIGASLCCKFNINANSVSYFSAIIAIVSCILISVNNFTLNLIGALLVNFWLVLDCVDGNLARSVKKIPYGEFADGMSSYILVAFLGLSLGINAYNNGGVFFEKNTICLIIIGGLTSIFDSLTRLIYQKYIVEKNKKVSLNESKIDNNNSKINLIERIQEAMGIGGWLPLFIMFGIIFNYIDLVLIYSFCFYGCFFVAGNVRTVLHVLAETREILKNEENENA